MSKKIVVVFIGLVLFGCKSVQPKSSENLKSEINLILDNWHKAAAEANFANYFNVIAEDGIFIGTDATENWDKKQFIEFSKPFFDKGKAWNFTALERNIYFSEDKKTVWFDELLNTQMKICRGSGVLMLENNGRWKIKQYVLSMTIPNDNSDEVVKIKAQLEDKEIEKFKNKPKNNLFIKI